MPIWGPIFHQIESDQDWGNVRVENLVKYLQTVQQKSDPSRSVTVMTAKHERRSLRIIVWRSRALGWTLIALAIINSLQVGVVTQTGAA